MNGVDVEHVFELAAVDDQDPVEALSSERPDPALGVSVRIRRSDRRPDDLHAFAAEHVAERAAELAVAVVNEEARGSLSVGEAHEQVTRLLCHPASVRVAGARDELDAATLE